MGVNVTEMVQLAPEAKLAPQLFVWAKSPLLVAVIVMPLMVNEEAPTFFIVTFFAPLVVPTV